MGVRKALGVAAWLVLGIQTKDTKVLVKVAPKNVITKKAESKPGWGSNPFLKLIKPVQPKSDEIKLRSKKERERNNSRVAVAEPKELEAEKIAGLAEKNMPLPVGLKLEVKEVPQVNGGSQPVIPEPISLEEIIKAEAATGIPKKIAEEADLGPEPVVKKIENVADIPKKLVEPKAEIAPAAVAHESKVEIKSDKSLFEPSAEAKPGSTEKEEEKPKEEAPKAFDIQETLSNLFAESLDDEVSTLDALIASLPNVTIEEILNEIKDVEALLGEYVQAK